VGFLKKNLPSNFLYITSMPLSH